jgi:hypothetical protein
MSTSSRVVRHPEAIHLSVLSAYRRSDRSGHSDQLPVYGVSGSWDGQARTNQRLWLVPTNAIRPVYGGIISLRRMRTSTTTLFFAFGFAATRLAVPHSRSVSAATVASATAVRNAGRKCGQQHDANCRYQQSDPGRDHDVTEARKLKWERISNGALLKRAEAAGFNRHQQSGSALDIVGGFRLNCRPG